MLRTMKILLVVTVASWGFVGALHNVIDWDETTGAVGAATSMATFDQGPASWQATNNLLVVWLGSATSNTKGGTAISNLLLTEEALTYVVPPIVRSPALA